jgi:hypothetical protein
MFKNDSNISQYPQFFNSPPGNHVAPHEDAGQKINWFWGGLTNSCN